jgi:hypothetical protein
MQCFNHPEKSAIGICKSCQRGLCSDCATDLEHGLACKNHHEKQVEELNSLISRNTKINKVAPKARYALPFLYLFMGLVFAGFGYFEGDGITGSGFILGCGFIVFGIYFYIYNKQVYRTLDKD